MNPRYRRVVIAARVITVVVLARAAGEVLGMPAILEMVFAGVLGIAVLTAPVQ